MTNDDKRIVELETKISYQEDLVQELNQLVISQQQQIDKLEVLCELLREQFKELILSLPEGVAGDETPPHY